MTASLSRAVGQLLLAVLLVASVVPSAGAQSIPPAGEGWSEPERWAWEQIRAGRIADFNAREEGNALDPRNPGNWGEGRRLSAGFLNKILFREPYREAIPVEGVRIVGAWFAEAVDLANGHLDRQLWLEKCRFAGAVDLTGLRVDGWLYLEGSGGGEQNAGPASLSLYGAEINGSINMNRTMFRDVELGDVRVTGQLVMHDATVKGVLSMRGLEVGQHLLMRGATFQDVDLASAQIGTQLDMSSTTITGPLDMDSIEVAKHLLMRGGTFQDVDLGSARIAGQLTMQDATVKSPLDMDSLEVGQHLRMRGGTFQDVDLANARITGQLTIQDATVKGVLGMRGLEVGQHLLMRGGTFQDVDLGSARIAGQLNLDGAKGQGFLNMHGLRVGGLLMRKPAVFRDVELTNAQVAEQLSMMGAVVTGQLGMNGLEVGQHLLMGADATFKDVDLTGAEVGGQLNLSDARVDGTLTMDSLAVEQSVFVFGATLTGRVNLIFARIGANLDLAGSELTELDLTGTRITGELRLGSARALRTKWRKGAGFGFNLRNAHAGALQDRRDRITDPGSGRHRWEDAWPDELQLEGFTYDRLGGFASTAANGTGDVNADVEMLARDIRWYIAWLARDPSYEPQPYEQLAAVFRAAGEPAKADDILYESRERARKEAADWWRWLGLSLSRLTIGYGLGLGYFRTLWWVLGFTLLGTTVLVWHRQGPERLPAKAFFSLDRLLPRLVELDKTHDEVEAGLKGWVRRYFYLHKIVGYVLAGFLLAGLAGLTQT